MTYPTDPGAEQVPGCNLAPRCRRAATAVVVVVAMLTVGLAGCYAPADNDEPESRASTPHCDPTSTLPAPRKEAQVTLSKSGASVDRDPQGRPRISYGVVLKNTAKLVAHLVKVRIRVMDGSDAPMSLRNDTDSPFATEAEYMPFGLQPGEQFGIGNYAYLQPTPGGKLPAAVEVKAEVYGVSWFLMCAPWGMQRLSVSDVETARKGSTAVITFTADLPPSCTYSELTSDIANLQAIHYDTAGAVVGGDVLDFEDQDLEDPLARHPHRVTATAYMPSGADPRRTELYTWAACAGPSASAK